MDQTRQPGQERQPDILRRAIEAATPWGIAATDLDGRQTYVNRAFCSLVGWNETELTGASPPYVYWPKEERDTIERALRLAQCGKTPRDGFELRFCRRDGTRFDALVTVSPLQEDHQPRGWVMSLIDISRTKKANEALVAREAQLRLVADATPVWITYIDREWRYRFMNKAHAVHHGRPPEEILGRTVQEVMSESRFRVLRPHLERALAGQAVQCEFSVPAKEGRQRHLFASYVPDRDEAGQVRGIVAIITDLTEHRQAQAALREAQERLHAVVTNAPLVLFTLDRTGVFTLVEGRGLHALGLKSDEAVGRNVFEIYPVDHWIPISARRALAGEALTSTQDANGLWFETYCGPVRDEAGVTTGVIGLAFDVTDKKRAEEELFRARKLESIGLLAGGIAHDFNNVLTAIAGNLAIARLFGRGDEKAFAHIEESEKAALRARALTEKLLAFSKGGKPVKRTLMPARLLTDAARVLLQGPDVRAEVSIAEDLWPIEADEGQLTQVFHNLLLNARQAMPDGGTVRVSASNAALEQDEVSPLPAGDYINIKISDQGSGIEARHLGRIFDPFFSTKKTGSGLGLTSAHWIVARHGGHINVRSESGTGSTFSVYLPRSDALPRDIQSDGGTHAGRGRILFMDDEAAIRSFAERMLSHLGYEVECAEDGSAAVDRYAHAFNEGRPFDLVILDLTVPGGMGGKEAVQRLLELDPQARVLVSSGYSNDPVLADFREYGYIGRIAKPYTAENLSETLQGLMPLRA